MNLKAGVVVFPGSNCDHDAYYSLKSLGFDTFFLWHKDKNLNNADFIILPGGFSYGDYLRSGAIAKLSPLMNEVFNFADKGGIVLGICNGFQILTEAGLLPGVLLKNKNLKFICKDVYLKVENDETIFTKSLKKNSVLRIPIAHGEGNYFTDLVTLDDLERSNRIVFRYCDSSGNINEESNPNGSLNNIAGIINKQGNVLGMMPHPERSCSSILGKTDGIDFFKSIIENFIN